jgi:hypothetical protein
MDYRQFASFIFSRFSLNGHVLVAIGNHDVASGGAEGCCGWDVFLGVGDWVVGRSQN